MRRKISKVLAASIWCAAICHAEALRLYEAVEPHMGTMFQIKLYAANQESAEAGFRAAFNRIAQLDTELSDYKADSELNVATKAAAMAPTHVSQDLALVLDMAQKLSEETGGAFDVTVGPLTKLWRQARKEQRIPTADQIQMARAKCGFKKLHVDVVARTIRVDSPDMQLDLGAIAKGYAADEALKVLTQMGEARALVAASGDLAFGDAPPGESGWRIGVDETDKVLTLANAAVSTSGASEQFIEAGGKRYSHIIDPSTGMGLLDDITVTTIARNGLLADPAATAVSVLGCERGRSFIEKHPGLEAFIRERKNGQVNSFHAGNR